MDKKKPGEQCCLITGYSSGFFYIRDWLIRLAFTYWVTFIVVSWLKPESKVIKAVVEIGG